MMSRGGELRQLGQQRLWWGGEEWNVWTRRHARELASLKSKVGREREKGERGETSGSGHSVDEVAVVIMLLCSSLH